MTQNSPLPDGWKWASLGEIGQLLRGVSFRKEDSSEQPREGFVPVLRATNIQDEKLILDNELVFVPHKYVKPEQFLQLGDIVVCMSSGSKNLVGKTAQLFRDWKGSFGTFCAAIRPYPTINAHYVGYFFSTPDYRQFIRDKSAGININNLKPSDFEILEIPLPPLPEQERIVAKIEVLFTQLDIGTAALRRVQAGLKRYKTSVLKAACEGRLVEQNPSDEPASELIHRLSKSSLAGGDLPPLPEGWCWTTWEDVSPRVTVGFVGPMKNEYVDIGVPFLRSQNVRENFFSPEGLKYISTRFHKKISKSILHPGDIVVVRSGSVGVTCIIPESLAEANCSDLVVIQKSSALISKYGSYYMNSLAKREIRAGQVGVALIHFNTKSVAKMNLPLPPLAEQRRIVAEVERRLSVAQEIETAVVGSLARAGRLRQAILKLAFEGNLI